MNLIKKAWIYCKKNGIISTFSKIWDKSSREVAQWPSKRKEKKGRNQYQGELRRIAAEKKIYIVIPCIDWGIPLFQRPHQIATVLSQQPDTLVFFISDQYRFDKFAYYQEVSESLYLFSHRCTADLDFILQNSLEITVLMSWTNQVHLLETFFYDRLVYEFIDDMSLFYYYNQEMEEMHQHLMRHADITTATADFLYREAKPYAKNLLLLENAGDYTFFSSQKNIPIAPEIAVKVSEYSCVLGYYGALADWFDYTLINQVAKQQADWLFVLVGYDFDETLHRLADVPNILHIPAQPYQRLPSFVSGFTIQMIPFVLNEITRATSPVKLFEYMASGKPILTSDLPECRKYQSVVRYTSVEDFIEKVNFLFQEKENPMYLECLETEALANTWETRVKMLQKELERITP